MISEGRRQKAEGRRQKVEGRKTERHKGINQGQVLKEWIIY